MIQLNFIHGWGVNAKIFQHFSQQFPHNWQIFAHDLAGHGQAPLREPFSITAEADKLADSLDRPSFILGWSLGSQVALHLATRQPEKVRGLILMSGFAKLRASNDYPQGVNNALLNKMVGFFQQDYAKYVRQFLELQLLTTPERRPLIDHLLPDLIQNGTPQALQSALNALEIADARFLLPEIQQPTLIICGNKDAVTPPRMSEYLAAHLPHAQLHIIDKAAHAPFLSHETQCVALIEQFISHLQAA